MVQHADEVVDVVGPVAAGVQLLGQGEEGTGVLGEVVDVEDGLRVRDAILFEVGVQPGSWGSGPRGGGRREEREGRMEADCRCVTAGRVCLFSCKV